jgi:hypothetical protein
MKRIYVIIVFLLLTCGFYSFVRENEQKVRLIGVWVYSGSENGVVEYIKSDSFDRFKPGMEFKKNGVLIKRQNTGWCGTPPITYGDYGGMWKRTSDSTFKMRSEYWGGTTLENWRIVELNARVLKVKNLYYRNMR